MGQIGGPGEKAGGWCGAGEKTGSFFWKDLLKESAMSLSARPVNSAPVLYEEAEVPSYTLPDPLVGGDGRRVEDAKDWRTWRRQELLDLFSRHVYGRLPGPLPFRAVEREAGAALEGLATREQVRLEFEGEEGRRAALDVLIHRPHGRQTPAPVFLGLNFRGNHATTFDPAVARPESWVVENVPRGRMVSRWPYEDLIGAGYAVVTLYAGDAAPDSPEHWREGVAGLFFPKNTGSPGDEEPGALGWWAWALGRVVDYLLTRSEFDPSRIAVVGHSRLGKTALWAATQDERVALVVSNNSGCTGAALSRRCFGERGVHLNAKFPHWCCGNYRRYDLRENDLPIDQHELIALIAPRPVYVASASEDRWADPKGEFLAARAASSVYRLFGCEGLSGIEMPEAGLSVGDRVAYHLRPGKHDITRWDWLRYLEFANRMLGVRP